MIDNLDENKREEIIKRMLNDSDFRLEVVSRSPFWFGHFYFSHHLKFEMANCQKEMLQLLQNNKDLLVIAMFRYGGKSTLGTMIFPIWAVLGVQQLKFAVIVSETQRQAEQHLSNIRIELEQNHRLIRDLGPFYEERDQWGRLSLVIKHYGAKFLACSPEQPIRGIKHRQYRPQLFILDDIESMQSIRTPEARDKLWIWYQGEIVPAGGADSRTAVLGGVLHPDSFISRLQRAIKERRISGVCRAYQIVNSNGEVNWPARFPTAESLETERKKYESRAAWEREMQLNPIQDEQQIIRREMLKYCEVLPDFKSAKCPRTVIAIDPAAALSETSDFTAMVAMTAIGYDDDMRIFIHPYPVNERMSFNTMKERAISLAKTVRPGHIAEVITEGGGTQLWLAQELNRSKILAKEFSIRHLGKPEKMKMLAAAMEAGQVFLPRLGSEQLVTQLLEFDVVQHDDLADALAMGVIELVMSKPPPIVEVFSIPGPKLRTRRLSAWDYDDD